MTAPRIELAQQMLEEHRHVEREILPELLKIDGPPLSRSAVYSWVRGYKRLMAEREAA